MKIKVIALIVVLTSLAYAHSLNNSFVLDDYGVIVHNDFVKSWKNFPAIFTRAYLSPVSEEEYLETRRLGSGEVTYRPVVTMTYFLDYSLWKLNPFGYHLINLLLHIFNAILLYLFINLISRNQKLAFFSALFFSLHPVNAETVSVVTFREDLLVFLFFILSFIFYIKVNDFKEKGKGSFFYCLSLFSFMLALFSKEMAITLPLLLIMYDYFFDAGKSARRRSFFRFRYLGYIAVSGAYLWVWRWFRGDVQGLLEQGMYRGWDFYTNFLTMSRVVAVYIGWLFLPVNIRPALPRSGEFTSSSIFEPAALFSVLLIMACFAVAVKIYRRHKDISFGIFWFFITLLPVSNVFPIPNVIASRFLYIPAVGFYLILAGILCNRKAAKGLLVILLVFYSIFTMIRSVSWRNNLVLWQGFAETYPESPKVHRVLGEFFAKEGLLDKAIIEYETAARLAPDNADIKTKLEKLRKPPH